MEKDLWLQCVKWLVSTGVLDPAANLRITKPADLASLLLDGVLLCELLLKFLPGCIDRNEMFLQYEENRKSPFMRAKNISLFLTCCQTHFGLVELFDCNDLYDLDDFGRVLKVLSLLSHSTQARSFCLRPFPDGLQRCGLDESTCENIYCNLREEVEVLTADNSCTYRGEDNPAEQYGFIGTFQENNSQREKLYDSILAHKTPSTKLVPIRYAEFKPVNERGHCLRELLDTESNYCEALAMIIENFYNKLRFQLSADDMETIFINIKDIYQVHKHFLAKLAPAVLLALGIDDAEVVAAVSSSEDKENLQIADVFLLFKLQFIPYAQFCSLLKASTSRIDELERSKPEICRYIEELSKSVNQNQFKLRDLLVIPMQRILKYPLLLKELIKTSPDISEQTRLDAAYEAMKDVSTYINEMKRDHEKIEVINTVQRSVVSYETELNVPFTKYGRLLQDGAVKLADNEEGSSRPKQRYIFLFEKMLIICKQKGSFYEFRRGCTLSEYELLDNNLESTTNKVNTISRKLTSSFFDNTSVTLLRRGHAALINLNGANSNINNNNNNNNNKCGTLSNMHSTVSYDGTSTLSSINSLSLSPAVQMIFKTVQQKNDWRKELKNALDINNPPLAIEKGHSLLYKTYTCAITCSICRKLLAGKFYQGYHCSGCNRDMHLACCHLQRCVVRRLPFPPTPRTIGAGRRARSNSTINFFSSSNQFQVGDLVVTTRKIIPSTGEANRLSCNSGELIEITDVNFVDGVVVGRMNTGKSGILPVDCIARTSDTLRKTAERSRHSTNSFNDSLADNQSGVVPLVSKAIIMLSEEKGILDLNKQPWFFGNLEREKATQLLEKSENGTFLMRYSLQQQKYVISLKCSGREKHMKIEYCPDSCKYYLHEGRFFDSIVDLVNFYRHHNLSEGFNNLDAILNGTPLKGNIYRVLQSYERRDEKYLTLQAGDVVTVLETCGEQKGWWKGSVNGKVGFFPISYVKRVDTAVSTMPNGYSYAITSPKASHPLSLFPPPVSTSALPSRFLSTANSLTNNIAPPVIFPTTLTTPPISTMQQIGLCENITENVLPIQNSRHQAMSMLTNNNLMHNMCSNSSLV